MKTLNTISQYHRKCTWRLSRQSVLNQRNKIVHMARNLWQSAVWNGGSCIQKNSYYACVLASDYIQQIMASGVRDSSKNSRGLFLQLHNAFVSSVLIAEHECCLASLKTGNTARIFAMKWTENSKRILRIDWLWKIFSVLLNLWITDYDDFAS